MRLGMRTFLLSYRISVPLGIGKAVRAGTPFDTATTFIVLLGYAIPSFVLGVLLLVYFAGGTFLQWFPLRGLTSSNWADLSVGGMILSFLCHIMLAVTALGTGSFAVTTGSTHDSRLTKVRTRVALTP